MAFPYIPSAGVTPLGTTELSEYRPLPPPPVIRADKLDYQNQAFTSVFSDRDPTDAAVIEALWRVRGSGAAVRNTGAQFLNVRKLDDKAKILLENEARLALSRLVRRGDITITKIKVETGNDWAEVSVFYVNNRTPLAKKDRIAKKRLPEEIS
ncbi:MAG: hypothetical protein WC565_04860 [Parcubacteria group bacterium]